MGVWGDSPVSAKSGESKRGWVKGKVFPLGWEPALTLGALGVGVQTKWTPRLGFLISCMVLSCKVTFLAKHFYSSRISAQGVQPLCIISASEGQKTMIPRTQCCQINGSHNPSWVRVSQDIACWLTFYTKLQKLGRFRGTALEGDSHVS